MISPPWAVEAFGYSLWSWLVCCVFVLALIFRSRNNGVPYPFALYIALYVIFTITAYNPQMAFLGVYSTYENGLCQVALTVAASGLCINRQHFRTIVRGLIVVVAFQAILQYAFPYNAFLTPYGVWQGRAYAPFGSPIFLGAWLAVAGVWALPGSSWPYWLLWALALLATKTRGAILAAVVGLLFANRNMLYRFLQANKAVMAVPFILVMLWGAVRQEGISKSDSGRLALYAVCAKAIKEKPWFGWGPENAIYAIQKHRDSRFNEIYTSTTQGHCHNQILEAAITGGVILPVVVVLIAAWVFLTITGDTGRGAFVAYVVAGAFNPISISVKVLGAIIFCANLRKSPTFPLSPIWLATLSLVAALYCSRNYVVTRDMTLPVSARLPAARAIGILD